MSDAVQITLIITVAVTAITLGILGLAVLSQRLNNNSNSKQDSIKESK